MLSGTMANQIALRTHLSLDRPRGKHGESEDGILKLSEMSLVEAEEEIKKNNNTGRSEGTTVRGPPYSILCDARAHILNYEAGGAAALSGAMVEGVMPRNGRYLTLMEDVVPHAVVSMSSSAGTRTGTGTGNSLYNTSPAEDHHDYTDIDIHSTPTALVAIENTLRGMIFPLEEMRRIASWTRSKGIALHLDGARLWEVAAAAASENETNTTLRALKSYACLPDSASLCLSKGLCAPIGTVLVGSNRFIRHARRIRKMLGGGVRMAGLVAVPGRVALEEGFIGSGSVSGSVSGSTNGSTNENPTGNANGDANGDATASASAGSSAGSTLRRTHATVRNLAEYWTSFDPGERASASPSPHQQDSRRFRLLHPPETNQLWLDLAGARTSEARLQAYMADAGIRGGGRGRFIVHAQICAEAVARLEGVMRRCAEGAGGE